jgi:polyferredoxin
MIFYISLFLSIIVWLLTLGFLAYLTRFLWLNRLPGERLKKSFIIIIAGSAFFLLISAFLFFNVPWEL